MLEIERLNESHINAIQKVSVEDEQLRFAGTAEEFLQDGSDTAHLHVIKHDGSIVGFFKLDIAYSESYQFCPSDGLGLRFFVIDKSQQGKGLGTKAVKALFDYLKKSCTRALCLIHKNQQVVIVDSFGISFRFCRQFNIVFRCLMKRQCIWRCKF
uniref:GNAT family N-acetyltransferase n=1 Tax=Vibrio cholerae TaxID=666 RepID=UPI003F584493